MRTRVAAIEFGTSKIVTLIAESGSYRRLDIIGSGTVPYDGYRDGDWITPGKLAQAVYNSISAAEKDANTKIKDIYIGVPGEYIHVETQEATVNINAETGRVSEEDIDLVQDMAADVLKFDKRQIPGNVIHRSPAWFRVDDGEKTMQPLKMAGERLTACVSFVTIEQFFINDMMELMDSMGISINGFLSSSFGEMLWLTSVEDRERALIFIDSGFMSTEISIIEGDGILYHAMLPVGGAHLTEKLAEALAISGEEAERLKRSFVIAPDGFETINPPDFFDEFGRKIEFDELLVSECMREGVDEMCDMIDRTIDEDGHGLIVSRTPVYLTGGGLALIRGGKDYLSAYLNRSVKVPQARAAQFNSPVYSSAMGLVDLIFASIDQRLPEEETLPGRLADGFRGLFGRR